MKIVVTKTRWYELVEILNTLNKVLSCIKIIIHKNKIYHIKIIYCNFCLRKRRAYTVRKVYKMVTDKQNIYYTIVVINTNRQLIITNMQRIRYINMEEIPSKQKQLPAIHCTVTNSNLHLQSVQIQMESNTYMDVSENNQDWEWLRSERDRLAAELKVLNNMPRENISAEDEAAIAEKIKRIMTELEPVADRMEVLTTIYIMFIYIITTKIALKRIQRKRILEENSRPKEKRPRSESERNEKVPLNTEISCCIVKYLYKYNRIFSYHDIQEKETEIEQETAWNQTNDKVNQVDAKTTITNFCIQRRRLEKEEEIEDDENVVGEDETDPIYITMHPESSIEGMVRVLGDEGLSFGPKAYNKVTDGKNHFLYMLFVIKRDLFIVQQNLSRIGASYGYILAMQSLDLVNKGLVSVRVYPKVILVIVTLTSNLQIEPQLDHSRVSPIDIHNFFVNHGYKSVVNVTVSTPTKDGLVNINICIIDNICLVFDTWINFFVNLRTHAEAMHMHRTTNWKGFGTHLIAILTEKAAYAGTKKLIVGKNVNRIASEREIRKAVDKRLTFHKLNPESVIHLFRPKSTKGTVIVDKINIATNSSAAMEAIMGKPIKLGDMEIKWSVRTPKVKSSAKHE